jgi:Aspartate/tyrosine/aromatic aminotransferase
LATNTASLVPSKRSEALGFSDIVKIRNRVLELRKRGVPVLEFQGGEPFAPTPDFVKEAINRALAENQTRYAPSSGIAPLLGAIVEKAQRKNGLTIPDSQVIVTSGGAHGLFCAFQAILDPGDEVIFFSPYWTPIKDQVTYCGAIPVRVPWDDLYSGDVAEVLNERITPRTKLIYLNSPSNPTGNLLDRAQLQSIANVAIERNLAVISDEAYEDLVYDGREHVSIASLPEMYERTLSVFTLSKTYAMTGLRLGYVVADEPWMQLLRKLVLNTINGVSTPTQYGGAAAMADRSDYLERMRSEYTKRRDLLVAALNEHGLRCATPHGAFYLFADVRERLGDDSWKAMNDLLDRTSIASVPGVVFGQEGEGHVRMSFSVPIETIEKAVDALKKL